MTSPYTFPPYQHKTPPSVTEQLAYIRGEVGEALEAYNDMCEHDGCDDYRTAFALECWDIIHATETLLRMLLTHDQAEITHTECVLKNRKRGYYCI